MDNQKVSKSRLSMAPRKYIREMRRKAADHPPSATRTYQIPQSNDNKSTPTPSVASKPYDEDICKEVHELSLSHQRVDPKKSSVFDSAEVSKNKKDGK